jgi:hypothetical protein
MFILRHGPEDELVLFVTQNDEIIEVLKFCFMDFKPC